MGYSSQVAKEFIKKIAPIIQKEAKARGYLVCSPVIAQAIVESAAGTSLLSSKYNNFHGLKCGSAWKGASVNMRTKEEYTVGTLTSIRDNFRAYPTMEDGVKGYYDFISTKRYANLKSADTPQLYLERIKADGYATASNYVSTNMSVINKYDLTQYDENKPVNKLEPVHGMTQVDFALPLVKKGDKNDFVAVIQTQLNAKYGFRLAIDSVFGNATEQAVISVQGLNNLTKDGKVGKNTWKVLGYIGI